MTAGCRVLIVDDDPEYLAPVEEGLRALGHEVSSVRSGKEAIDQALGREFDVVLLDLMMPRMDGLQVAMYLHQALGDKKPRIIVVTAMSVPKDEDIKRLAKPVQVLHKPLSLSRLDLSIRDAFKDGN